MVDGGVPFAPRPSQQHAKKVSVLTRSLVTAPMFTATEGSIAVLAFVLLLGLIRRLFRCACGR